MRVAEKTAPVIDRVRVGAFRIPTDFPESDGTLDWRATTLLAVEIVAGDERGFGYTYADTGTARLIVDKLEPFLRGRETFDIEAIWWTMFGRLRNLGRQGMVAMAVSAIDTALWDLKARLLGLPLVRLLGTARDEMPVYGSGGFTNYSDAQLRDQFHRWAEHGIERFKMKVGRDPSRDRVRVGVARAEIGTAAELFVDANSAYTRRQALEAARTFAGEFNVRWLEEPLPPEDHAGLRFLRERVPAPLEIAEGEYGYDLDYFRRLFVADAVDVAMADATRCGGVTGFLKIAALCEAWTLPLSSHGAPTLHYQIGCATKPMRHAEYFHDHERIEHEFFDGAVEPHNGALRPDLSRPGLGIEFKWSDAERFAV